ncbi:MAG TPA: SDR family NAD(P)-dependent oxidoreductase [Polyangiaceae bacterium]|nr:SDR family NAD(P)-dependent oxidoreductase [Polyangiaceae bacterium]
MAAGRQTVLVTGASTGLGLALARRLIGDTKHRLVLTARSKSLPRFAAEGIAESEGVLIRPLDVTRDEERRRLIQEIDERWGGVDVLINNAGVSYRSVLEHVTEREFLSQMLVNYVGPVELARLVLPSMRSKRAGRIINVSSVGGMMAMPTMAIYSASKFALEGATESLYYEVKPWNIKVSLVQPGFINSSSFENVRLTAAGKQSVGDSDEAYHKHYEHMSSFIARLMRLAFATPDSIARRIVDIMHRRNPPLRSLVTFDAWLFAHLRRFLPRAFYHWLLYRCLPGVREWGTGPGKTLPAPTFADAPTYIPPSMAPNLSAAFFRFVPNPVPSGPYGQPAPSPAPSGAFAQAQPAPPGVAAHAPSLGHSGAPGFGHPGPPPPAHSPSPTQTMALLPPVALPSVPPPMPSGGYAATPPPMPSGAFAAPPPMPGGAKGTAPPPMPSGATPGAPPPMQPDATPATQRPAGPLNESGKRGTLQLAPRFSRNAG